jgi:hypothetical protein
VRPRTSYVHRCARTAIAIEAPWLRVPSERRRFRDPPQLSTAPLCAQVVVVPRLAHVARAPGALISLP